ncbi:MAG: hypothetical protein A2383_00480 [Candidatus Pacebacteria bacterium RIFOXYB1_FULL_39_46]|nr:MAG: hypothetical protein A2182_00310 [Candidatus Pacebacteria bacterium RIFOXYA1_FULL_38_18]OGJ38064.1 MAG: hypothetical protein A2383_00480 [Candidatus Pacebacteria bacterium RIFOXYB1_FULL_39_46]OGJ39713.1 MAG: hypothetical protein A2411_02965 [Candidatus Pacebacteria bacterium RIFOXYC1_FULL_39_21]OGJ39816.1 MAG: hypothetical protein A2582_00245 [Candidatus Pacebacteria bacterium RIFOXYD1_FULL_39_27]
MNNLIAQQTTINLSGAADQANLPGSSVKGGFGGFMSTLMSAIMVVAVLVAFIYLLLGALGWITSEGDKSKLESSRNKITQALIGLIVLASTTALFILLQKFLNICILDFGGTC